MARVMHCGYCYNNGHNKRGCPKMKQDAADGNTWAKRQVDTFKARAASQKAAGGRKCGYCEERGHTRRTCSTLKNNKATSERINREWRSATLEWFKNIGLGTGALVKYEGSVYVSGQGRIDGPHIGLITGVDWDRLNHRIADKYGSNASCLTAMITAAPGDPQRLPIPRDLSLAPGRHSDELIVISPVTASAVEAEMPSHWQAGELPEDWFDKDAKHWNWQDNNYDDGRFAKRQVELTETSN